MRSSTTRTRQRIALAGIAALGLALSPALMAQADEELVSKRQKKLQSAFLKRGKWILDYGKARAEAKKTGKLIFAYFTRSYAP